MYWHCVRLYKNRARVPCRACPVIGGASRCRWPPFPLLGTTIDRSTTSNPLGANNRPGSPLAGPVKSNCTTEGGDLNGGLTAVEESLEILARR